jgi:hypothetical protein
VGGVGGWVFETLRAAACPSATSRASDCWWRAGTRVTVHGFCINWWPGARDEQSGTAMVFTEIVRTAERDDAMTTLISDPVSVRRLVEAFFRETAFASMSGSPPGVFSSGGSTTGQLPAAPLRNPSARGGGPTHSRSVARHQAPREVTVRGKIDLGGLAGSLGILDMNEPRFPRSRSITIGSGVRRPVRAAAGVWRTPGNLCVGPAAS